jgi:hypothetical protein
MLVFYFFVNATMHYVSKLVGTTVEELLPLIEAMKIKEGEFIELNEWGDYERCVAWMYKGVVFYHDEAAAEYIPTQPDIIVAYRLRDNAYRHAHSIMSMMSQHDTPNNKRDAKREAKRAQRRMNKKYIAEGLMED